MEEDLHGPGIDARGAAFPGVNLYVQLGRGRDYAWSATSAGQDIIDTFAVPVRPCGDADARLDRYVPRPVPADRGARAHERWTPNLGRPDAGRLGDAARRAHEARARRRARHVSRASRSLYTVLRSTYMHEVDSAVGFADVQRARHDHATPQDFQRAASRSATRSTGSTSTPSTSPTSTRATTRCAPKGIDRPAARWRADKTSGAASTPNSTPRATRRRPSIRRSIDQPCITSWNNKQAQGYAGADSQLCSARSTARRCSTASSRCG